MSKRPAPQTKTRPGNARRERATFATVGLFAGIGGFELGLAKAGHHSLMLCDSDRAATAVLKKRFPSTSLVGDVRTLRAFPTDTELVCAGFPCQNLTQVGDKSGITGEKSSLVTRLFFGADSCLATGVGSTFG